MSTVSASSLAVRRLGRDRTHIDRETMDGALECDSTVEAPQLQHGGGFRQIEAGPTQCESVVSMPVASVPPTVLASSGVNSAQSHGRRVVPVPQSSGTPRSIHDIEGRQF